MVCTCPDGYVSDDNGSCKTLTPNLAGCTTDDECGNMDSCNNQLCKDPCACGEHAFFRVVEHKPVQPRRGLPLDRVQGGRRLFGHARLSQQEVPAPVRAGQPAVRRRSHLAGHQIRGRVLVRPRPGGRSVGDLLRGGLPLDRDCPGDKACYNSHCIDPCSISNTCVQPAECTVEDCVVNCDCPPGFEGSKGTSCTKGRFPF